MDVRVPAEAVALDERREPFVLASVIGRRGPSSGQEGAKAIILSDGSIRGWLGGACATPTVVREALAALGDGEPRRVQLGTEGEEPMACHSEGALEIYLEPMVPPPQVVVLGGSPAVAAIGSMAEALGWRAVVLDTGESVDLSGVEVDGATAIIVATQGHYDDEALAAALQTEAGYIGLIASERRAKAVRDQLATSELGEEQLSRIHAPAGLDLGPTENVEIAAAVIADLVARKARGELRIAE